MFDPGSVREVWLRALEAIAPINRGASPILPVLIDDLAAQHPAAPALLSENACLTYQALAERANQYARWALGQGVGAGGVVGLLMPNCPEYMAVWLGITRVGGVVALINTNLSGNSLGHAIKIAALRRLIIDTTLESRLDAAEEWLPPGLSSWSFGPSKRGLPRVDQALTAIASHPLDRSVHPAPSLKHPALYIYTSGTTGWPKAAVITHQRLLRWSHWFAAMINPGPNDRMYNCLPMYHSVGGVVATGAMLVRGLSVAVRPRFSATAFWSDVCKWDCTLFQYIGELCRYLLNAPPHPLETNHKLRLCCGNGLREDIWKRFTHRFRIPHVLEFYAATEGNISLYNVEEKPGSVGRIPRFLAHHFPIALVKVDPTAGEPIRDTQGHCVSVGVDEAGEALGRIPVREGQGGIPFEGYADAAQSEGKLLRNVFEPGDCWFRSGDLLRKDRAGFYYFVDRAGDTFRWKGENVSTSEVADAISLHPGVIQAVVYGVEVPGAEGRAGMAALVTSEGFDLAGLHRHLMTSLPAYACPVFLRLCHELPTTDTFKNIKHGFVQEGYDPEILSDELYFNDRVSRSFVRLDAALFQCIRRDPSALLI